MPPYRTITSNEEPLLEGLPITPQQIFQQAGFSGQS